MAGKRRIVAQQCRTGHEISVVAASGSCAMGSFSYNTGPDLLPDLSSGLRDANAYAVSDTYRVLYPKINLLLGRGGRYRWPCQPLAVPLSRQSAWGWPVHSALSCLSPAGDTAADGD